MEAGDPRDEIVRLEAQIEELAATLESCRKFILAGRIAMVGGGVLLAATLFGAISFDPRAMLAGAAAVLGGIVLWGSNLSTAKQAAIDLAARDAQRAALIEQLDLHMVAARTTLH